MEETPKDELTVLIPKAFVSQYDHPSLGPTTIDARDRAAIDNYRERVEGKIAGPAVDLPADVQSGISAQIASDRRERVETPHGVMRREDVEYLQHTTKIDPSSISTPPTDVTPARITQPDTLTPESDSFEKAPPQ